MKTLVLMAALCCSMQAQEFAEYMYSSSTTAVTIQRPTGATKQLMFHQAWVYCVAAQTATLKWNGTAATTTAAAPVRLPATTLPAQAVAYTASDVGTGTTGGTYTVPAGTTFSIDLSAFKLGSTGSATNLSISTSGTCIISFSWAEL